MVSDVLGSAHEAQGRSKSTADSILQYDANCTEQTNVELLTVLPW